MHYWQLNECKCKHLQMKLNEMQVQTFSNETTWQSLQTQMHKMTNSCKTCQTFASHSTSFQAWQRTFSANSLCKDLHKRLHKSAQIGASSRVALFGKPDEPRTPKGVILLFSFHTLTLWTSLEFPLIQRYCVPQEGIGQNPVYEVTYSHGP